MRTYDDDQHADGGAASIPNINASIITLLQQAGYIANTKNNTTNNQLINSAITKAITVANNYMEILTCILSKYTTTGPANKIHQKAQIELFRNFTISDKFGFSKMLTAYDRTWKKLAAIISYNFKGDQLQNYSHHTLALLLNESDETFLTAVTNGSLPLGEEIGLIAIQRLLELSWHAKDAPMRSAASRSIKSVMQDTRDGIFNFNYTALVFEVTKLILHASDSTKNKIIWLGTARTVNAVIANPTREITAGGICLDCPEDTYSWGLNRAWLACAAALGYDFQLVEQHCPEIENAICSGSAVSLIEQLTRWIGPIEMKSQYTRGDSPTATIQEVLCLMSLGLVGKKRADGSLLLTKDSTVVLCQKPKKTTTRSRSAPSKKCFQLFSPVPPLNGAVLMQTPTENSSPTYRQTAREIRLAKINSYPQGEP